MIPLQGESNRIESTRRRESTDATRKERTDTRYTNMPRRRSAGMTVCVCVRVNGARWQMRFDSIRFDSNGKLG